MFLSSINLDKFFRSATIDSGVFGDAIRLTIDNASVSEGVIHGTFSIKFHTRVNGYFHRPCDSMDFNPSYHRAAQELVALFKQAHIIPADEPVDMVLGAMPSYSGGIEEQLTGDTRLNIIFELNDILCNFSNANEDIRLNAISCFYDKFPSIPIMEERPSVTCCIS